MVHFGDDRQVRCGCAEAHKHIAGVQHAVQERVGDLLRRAERENLAGWIGRVLVDGARHATGDHGDDDDGDDRRERRGRKHRKELVRARQREEPRDDGEHGGHADHAAVPAEVVEGVAAQQGMAALHKDAKHGLDRGKRHGARGAVHELADLLEVVDAGVHHRDAPVLVARVPREEAEEQALENERDDADRGDGHGYAQHAEGEREGDHIEKGAEAAERAWERLGLLAVVGAVDLLDEALFDFGLLVVVRGHDGRGRGVAVDVVGELGSPAEHLVVIGEQVRQRRALLPRRRAGLQGVHRVQREKT